MGFLGFLAALGVVTCVAGAPEFLKACQRACLEGEVQQVLVLEDVGPPMVWGLYTCQAVMPKADA